MGGVVKIISKTCLIFKATRILEFENSIGDILILSPRHPDINNFKDFENEVFIDGGLLNQMNYTNLKEKELMDIQYL